MDLKIGLPSLCQVSRKVKLQYCLHLRIAYFGHELVQYQYNQAYISVVSAGKWVGICVSFLFLQSAIPSEHLQGVGHVQEAEGKHSETSSSFSSENEIMFNILSVFSEILSLNGPDFTISEFHRPQAITFFFALKRVLFGADYQ